MNTSTNSCPTDKTSRQKPWAPRSKSRLSKVWHLLVIRSTDLEKTANAVFLIFICLENTGRSRDNIIQIYCRNIWHVEKENAIACPHLSSVLRPQHLLGFHHFSGVDGCAQRLSHITIFSGLFPLIIWIQSRMQKHVLIVTR